MSDRKTGYSPTLNAENSRGVTHGFMFAYAHDEIIFCFLLYFIYFFFLFLFYGFNLNTQDFVYLEFVKYQLGFHKRFLEMQSIHICYTVVLYKDMSRLSSYIERNSISFYF